MQKRRFQYEEFVTANRWVRDKKTGQDHQVARQAMVIDAAFINSKSETASTDNDLYTIRFEDGHQTNRYRNELCDR